MKLAFRCCSSLKLQLYTKPPICQILPASVGLVEARFPCLGRADAVHDHASSEDQELRGSSAAVNLLELRVPRGRIIRVWGPAVRLGGTDLTSGCPVYSSEKIAKPVSCFAGEWYAFSVGSWKNVTTSDLRG